MLANQSHFSRVSKKHERVIEYFSKQKQDIASINTEANCNKRNVYSITVANLDINKGQKIYKNINE